MSKNCDIHIKGADGALRSVLYCRDNISPQCIRPIIVRAVEIANENASLVKYHVNAKSLAALIVIAAWERHQLIAPDLSVQEDVDFHVEVQLETDRIAVTIRSCEWDTEDRRFDVELSKCQDGSEVPVTIA